MKNLFLKLKFKKKVVILQKKMLKQERKIKKSLDALSKLEPKGKEFIIEKQG